MVNIPLCVITYEVRSIYFSKHWIRLIRNMCCFTGSVLWFILQHHVDRMQKEAVKEKMRGWDGWGRGEHGGRSLAACQQGWMQPVEHWQIIEEFNLLAYEQQNKPTDRDVKSVLGSADDFCLCSENPHWGLRYQPVCSAKAVRGPLCVVQMFFRSIV